MGLALVQNNLGAPTHVRVPDTYASIAAWHWAATASKPRTVNAEAISPGSLVSQSSPRPPR